MKIITLFTLLFCLSFLLEIDAQNVDAILQSVEKNNLTLQNARANAAACRAETDADVNLFGPTTVEYSPFFHQGVSGIANSELIVSQELEFPSLYSSRRHMTTLKDNVVQENYRILHRDVLLQAEELCIDFAMAREKQMLIDKRLANIDTLLVLCQRRLEYGDATVIDINRIKMDKMRLITEELGLIEEKTNITDQLVLLNGGKPLENDAINALWESKHFTDNIPLITNDVSDCAEMATAEAECAASRHALLVARRQWLPTLTVGYRRNTELREAYGGFLVGVSIPLFSNSKKIKAARLRQNAAELTAVQTETEATKRQERLITKVVNLQRTLAAYDLPLMEEGLQSLYKAVTEGQLSIIDYHIESDRVFSTLQERINTENELYHTLAQLQKYQDL